MSQRAIIMAVILVILAQLVTAIHEINPFQRMAMMTAKSEEGRAKLPRFCATSRCCGSLSVWSKCYGCCGSPCCHFDWRGVFRTSVFRHHTGDVRHVFRSVRAVM